MRKFFTIASLLALGACSTASITTTPVDTAGQAKAVFALKTSYEAALVLAVAYNKLPPCGVTAAAPVICRNVEVVAQLRLADSAASTGINAAENAVRSLGASTTVVAEAIVAAQAATKAFEAIVKIYPTK